MENLSELLDAFYFFSLSQNREAPEIKKCIDPMNQLKENVVFSEKFDNLKKLGAIEK